MKIWHCHLCIRVTLNYVYSPFIIKIMSQKKNTHCRSAFSFSKSLARYLSSLLNLFPPDREPSKFNQSINQSINQLFIHPSFLSFIHSFIYWYIWYNVHSFYYSVTFIIFRFEITCFYSNFFYIQFMHLLYHFHIQLTYFVTFFI